MTRDHTLTFDGITQPITEWALDYGIPPELITRRLRDGWTVARAITTPMKVKPGARLSPHVQRFEHAGLNLTITEWAKHANINRTTLRKRLAEGVPIAQAIQPERRANRNRTQITFQGVTRSFQEWAAFLGVSRAALKLRLATWPIERALTTPAIAKSGRRQAQRYAHAGLNLTLAEWADRLGVRLNTLHKRLNNGMTVAEAIGTPIDTRPRGRSKLSQAPRDRRGSVTRDQGNKTFEASP
ncbi:MAG TPA: hypothetical protein VGN97_01000 [Mesorhizobium sp.]|jgi:hypothetical protein|nr:hypothetical protein [Mesorhizobium sp.]